MPGVVGAGEILVATAALVSPSCTREVDLNVWLALVDIDRAVLGRIACCAHVGRVCVCV